MKLVVFFALLVLSSFTMSQSLLEQIFINWRNEMNNGFDEVIQDETGDFKLSHLNLTVDSLYIVTDKDTTMYYWQIDSIGNKIGMFMEYVPRKFLKIIFGFHSPLFQYSYTYFPKYRNRVKRLYVDSRTKSRSQHKPIHQR
jgi:hypothetical protein